MYNIPPTNINNIPIASRDYKNNYKMTNMSNMNKNSNVNTSKIKYHKNSYNTKYIEAK
jgi:hypothetical protein